jgi:hypothetical protein
MAKLLLIVVAVVWAAVLIPPLLRSRVDNRPSSSVTDFRRQLNRLQSTATPARGSARAIGRPLAQSSSPLARQAAMGRPGLPVAHRQATFQASSRGGGTAVRDRTGETTRLRSHGDPSGPQRRPQRADERRPQRADERRPQLSQREPRRPSREHTAPTTRPVAATSDPAAAVKRRRMNVLFILVVTSACTMFLAATTDSVAMLWGFGLSFIATCGYVYVLAQLRGRESADWNNGWLEPR